MKKNRIVLITLALVTLPLLNTGFVDQKIDEVYKSSQHTQHSSKNSMLLKQNVLAGFIESFASERDHDIEEENSNLTSTLFKIKSFFAKSDDGSEKGLNVPNAY